MDTPQTRICSLANAISPNKNGRPIKDDRFSLTIAANSRERCLPQIAASVGIGIIGVRTMDMISHENDILSDYGTDIVIPNAFRKVPNAF
jgi:hypothetical protein